MKATILDGHVLNPGDLSWEGFRKYGDVAIYDRTAEEDVIPRALGSEVIITNKVTFSRERMEKLLGLRYIGITATGYNIVDVKAAHELGITVTNVPDYSTEGVAESVFAHILRFTHRVSEHSAIVKEGGWKESGDFSFTAYPLIEIYGKRMGIIGMGHIGMRTGEIAKAFGMDVVYASRSPKPKAIEMGFRPLPLEELSVAQLSHIGDGGDPRHHAEGQTGACADGVQGQGLSLVSHAVSPPPADSRLISRFAVSAA